jgi:hypothetical protein
MQNQLLITKLSLAAVILFGTQRIGSQLMAQCGGCAAPQNPIYTCIPGSVCMFTTQTPAKQDCVGNCVSITQCVTQNFIGSSFTYAGICSSDGASCINTVLINTGNNVRLSTAVSGASCIGE